MRPIDADALKKEISGDVHELWHFTGVHAVIDDAPTLTLDELRPTWIDPKQRPPTKEDANEAGMILAVLKSDGYATAWWWSSVARHRQRFSGWMPLPEPPGEEGNHG